MKIIIIPKSRVKEFTRMLGKYNGIEPVQLKDGAFFIEDAYLKNSAMVSDCKAEIDKMRSQIKTFTKRTLTKVDYKVPELISKKL